MWRPIEGLNELENQLFLLIMKCTEFQMEDDPTSFEEAMRSVYSFKWQEAMEVEMNLMNTNDVWNLDEISNGAKTVGCKWVYKTKCDSNGNVERYKA